MDDALERLGRTQFGRSRAQCFERLVCLTCGQSAEEFRDAASKVEYSLSAMCQQCQDGTFQPLDDLDCEADQERFEEAARSLKGIEYVRVRCGNADNGADLVRGGQGRTADDVVGDGCVVGWVFACAVGWAVLALLWWAVF